MTILLSNLSLLIGGAALVMSVFLFLKTRKLSDRVEKLIAQTGGESIEETLFEHYDRFKKMESMLSALDNHHTATAMTATRSVHNVGMVRFNPFPGEIGGDQSFSIALLNGNETGIILTSLHSREGTRIYAKPVTNGSSEYNLSREEQHAIDEALTGEDL